MPNIFEDIVNKYRAFYRADKQYEPSSRKCVQPLSIALDAIAKNHRSSNEELTQIIAGEIGKLMDQVRSNTALGHWVEPDRSKERQLVVEFANFIVCEVWQDRYKKNTAAFTGNKSKLIQHTCEFIYRTIQDEENAKDKQPKSI